MTARRGGRPPQVRPRPPSSGRPAPVKVRPRAPADGRLTAHRRVQRTRRMALPFRALLVLAVIGLSVGTLFVANGGLGRAAASLGTTFAAFVADLTATPAPSPTPISVADSPLLDEPAEPYTNQPAVDLVGVVPDELVGDSEHRIRIYQAIGEQDPVAITDVAIGRTRRFLVPGVLLTEGTNAFTATVAGPGGESPPSPAITWVLDLAKPHMVLNSPRNGAVVNAATVELVGETQGRSAIRVRNATTNAIVTGEADESGVFRVVLPIKAGTNDIGITATDPAGNENHLVIALRRGSGKLTATLGASAYSVKVSTLPKRLELAIAVADPDGRPLEGAIVTFTLTIPSVPPLTSSQLETGGDGRATWSVTIPAAATVGQASATAIVQTTEYGQITDRTVITLK